MAARSYYSFRSMSAVKSVLGRGQGFNGCHGRRGLPFRDDRLFLSPSHQHCNLQTPRNTQKYRKENGMTDTVKIGISSENFGVSRDRRAPVTA